MTADSLLSTERLTQGLHGKLTSAGSVHHALALSTLIVQGLVGLTQLLLSQGQGPLMCNIGRLQM